MSLAREVVLDADIDIAAVAITDTPEGLCAIHQSGCAAAIWRRQPTREFQEWIDTLDPDRLPQTRVTLQPATVRAAMTELCAAAGVPDGPNRLRLIDDIAGLTDIFSKQMNTQYLHLRLEAISTNACRKFHVDVLTARLICTYRGVGTQYGVSANGEEPSRVFTVPTGAPIVLTGSKWPEERPTGLVHRSPPIEGTGETRLVLVLDPAQDPDAEETALR